MLGEQAEFDQVGQVEFGVFADGDGGHGHQGVVVQGIQGFVGGPGLAAQDVEAPADRVQHPPQTGPVLGVAVQMGVEGAVPVGPAAQGPFGVTVPAPFLLIGGRGFDLGHLLVELGQGTAFGPSISSAALVPSAATPSDTASACSMDSWPARAAAATSGWAANRRPVSNDPFGRRRAHTRLQGQLLGRGTVPGLLPAPGLRGPGRGQRLDRGGRRLDLRAQPHHLRRLRPGQSCGVEPPGVRDHRLSNSPKRTAHGGTS